ncbi:hypothetical protein PkP19E3_15380 [Pseudomonas koreensis]|nr:hypothetical protein PkP19E3_15380 [Pseudomonas koreensis]
MISWLINGIRNHRVVGTERANAIAGKRAPTGFVACTKPLIDTTPCGSGLAREGAGSVDKDVGCANAIAGKPAPTGFVACTKPLIDTTPCGSGLARESAGSVDKDVGCANAIAGKPAPTGFVACTNR